MKVMWYLNISILSTTNFIKWFYGHPGMGRIKTRLAKRITEELLERYSEKFTDKFEDNKKVVSHCIDTSSKKMRNIIAGFVSRQKKRAEA